MKLVNNFNKIYNIIILSAFLIFTSFTIWGQSNDEIIVDQLPNQFDDVYENTYIKQLQLDENINPITIELDSIKENETIDVTNDIIELDDLIDHQESGLIKQEIILENNLKEDNSSFKTDFTLQSLDIGTDADFKIIKTVIAFPELKTANRQWIEIYVQNKSSKNRIIDSQLLVTNPNGSELSIPKIRIEILAKSVQNIIFSFTIPKFSGGIYKVQSKIFNLAKKELATSNTNYEFVALGPVMKDDQVDIIDIPDNLNINGEPSEVVISYIKFSKKYSLNEKIVPIEFSVYNGSSYRVEDYQITIYLVTETNPYAPIGQAIYQEQNINLASGERKLRSFTVYIPENIKNTNLKLLADFSKGNNNFVYDDPVKLTISNESLIISDIIPITPLDNQIIKNNQNIIFSWESNEIKNYYLEFSSSISFNNSEQLVRIPGSTTIRQNSIELTEIEMFINYLLQQNNFNDLLYWRIVGIDSIGFIESISPIQKIIYQ